MDERFRLEYSSHMCWDSCVFIRYLLDGDHADDIERYIASCQKGDSKVWYSTIAFTEIRPRFLKHKNYGNIRDFFDDLRRNFLPIDPNPNILIFAGLLRDCDSVNPDPKAIPPNNRVIGTPDSIHLETCLCIKDVMGVSDIIFHTTDAGRSKSWEDRCVPMSGFERWFPPDKRSRRVSKVCELTRCWPVHPQASLFTGVRHLDPSGTQNPDVGQSPEGGTH